MTIKSQGQIDYEQDLKRCPCYPNGEPRRTWAELNDISRLSWQSKYMEGYDSDGDWV